MSSSSSRGVLSKVNCHTQRYGHSRFFLLDSGHRFYVTSHPNTCAFPFSNITTFLDTTADLSSGDDRLTERLIFMNGWHWPFKVSKQTPSRLLPDPVLDKTQETSLSNHTRYKWPDVTEIKPWLKFWYENQWEPNYQHLNVASTLLLPRSAMSAISNSWLGRPIPAR